MQRASFWGGGSMTMGFVLFATLFMATKARGDDEHLWVEEDTSHVAGGAEATRVRSNYVNVQLLPNSAMDQSEFSIAVDQNHPGKMLVGSNARRYTTGKVLPGYYYSSDGGLSWGGGDSLPGQPWHTSDPVVAFDTAGDAFYCHLDAHSATNIVLRKSSTGGNSWIETRNFMPPGFGGSDKPHMVVDVQSPVTDNVYLAWTQFDGVSSYYIAFNKTTSSYWTIMDTTKEISQGTTSYEALGVNLALAPNGGLYATWAVFNGGAQQDHTEDSLAFNRSSDGGEVWCGARNIVSVSGLGKGHYNRSFYEKYIRANTLPVMAVDTAGGEAGKLYLVWADRRYGDGQTGYDDADILVMKSLDSGETWTSSSSPARVNTDGSGNGRDQWCPWATVDKFGGLDVVFYDCRNDSGNQFTEVWGARSTDEAESFSNFRIGEVSFDPTPITYPELYFGDYIGITASDRIYACWHDNRYHPEGAPRAMYQAYVGVVPLEAVTGTVNENATWDLTTMISGSVYIDSGVTVTVRPGTKILADTGGAILQVAGELVIEGGGERPVFLSKSESSGGWSGIWVFPGGNVDWGDGCVIQDGGGVAVDAGAAMTEIRNVTLANSNGTGFYLGKSVALIHDTVVGDNADYGISIYECDPTIDSCAISGCGYGIYALGCSGTIQNTTIDGPAQFGVYILDGEGTDTLSIADVDIDGHFTGAHVYAGENVSCLVDSSEFTTSSVDSLQSRFGVKAYDGAWLKLRKSTILNCDTAFYSHNSASNLGVGTGSDAGQNMIGCDSCGGDCPGSFVVHECELIEARGGEPDPEPSCVDLKAEGNWWGSNSPDSSWFTKVDYSPWLSSPPSGKIVAPRDEYAVVVVPESPLLAQNYPNPFNAGTTVEFSLAAAGKVEIRVYNILGQVVRSLANDQFGEGRHQVMWDGRNERGEVVASGIYPYRLVAGSFAETKKMLLIK